MSIAIRTVSETDDVHVIEGYGPAFGGPFNGSDSYQTRFSARSNMHWDLFADSETDPKFIRPLNYQHGFDPEVGLSRVGGWSPVRSDDKGIWIQAQLDKHHAYYGAIRELLEKDALGFSPESAEHSVRIARDGEILDWPAYAMALTPTPSNPWSVIASRAADIVTIVEAVRAEVSTADMNDRPDSDFAYIEPGGEKDDEGKTTPRSLRHFPIFDAAHVRNALARLDQSEFGDKARAKVEAAAKKLGIGEPAAKSALRGIQTFSDIAAAAEMSEELPEAFDTLTSAIYSAIYALDKDFNPVSADEKRTAIQTSLDQFRDCVLGILDASASARSGEMFLSAIRAGKRNSASDQGHVDAIHSHAVALGATAHASDTPNDDEDEAAQEPDAARSSEALPTVNIVERTDLAALRAALLPEATKVGQETARRLTS